MYDHLRKGKKATKDKVAMKTFNSTDVRKKEMVDQEEYHGQKTREVLVVIGSVGLKELALWRDTCLK